MMRVVLLAAAAEEVDAAEAWYFERDSEVAARFRTALGAAVAQISEAPERWSISKGGVRHLHFEGFPYTVHYRVDPNEVVVVAVAHQHRRPGYWRARQ